MRTRTMLVMASLLLSSGCAFKPYDDRIYQGVPLAQPSQDADGRLTYGDGTLYRGDTRNGAPHGNGEFIFPNRDRYQGQVDNGLLNGTGTLSYHDGKRYEGQFAADMPRGKGKLTLANGDTQTGEFTGLHRVVGELHTAKGTYQGTFTNGQIDGDIFFTPRNSKLDRFQKWHQGQLVFDAPGPKALAAAQKRCKLITAEWIYVSGPCSNGLANGQGEAITPDYQQQAKGLFRQGDLVEGEYTNQNGTVVTGQLKKFQPHGKAQYFAGGKKIYDGGFFEGQRHGSGICLDNKTPERCEYHLNQRVDAGYLGKQLKQDVDNLQQNYTASIERIRNNTRSAEQEWRDDYRRKMKYIEDEIDSAEAGAMGKSMVMGTLYNASGNQAQAQAFIEQQAAELEDRKDELARLERDFNSEQRDAKARFAREQERKLSDLKTTHEREMQATINKHIQQCQNLPGRKWDSTRNLCVR